MPYPGHGKPCPYNRAGHGKPCPYNRAGHGKPCPYNRTGYGKPCPYNRTGYGKPCPYNRTGHGKPYPYNRAWHGKPCPYNRTGYGKPYPYGGNVKYDPRLHHRRSIRLRGYDYAGGGAYFVTICTRGRKCLFGEIVEGHMILNEAGRLVERVWHALPQRFGRVVLDVFQMMPNHLHGVFVLPGPGLEPALAAATGAPIIQPSATNFVGRSREDRRAVGVGLALPRARQAVPLQPDRARQAVPLQPDRARQAVPLHQPRRTRMGDVVGTFKSISTIALNKLGSRLGARPLQANFYEHIIRDVRELDMIRDYIVHNPQCWLQDPENPDMA